MPCYKPMSAYKTDSGEIRFAGREQGREIQLPCGQCIGCRIDTARDWAARCLHETQMHEQNWFLTLTYDEKNLPTDGSLDHRHWQLFAKRLRQTAGPFRFYMCGEYGEQNKRPHYHAIAFGLQLADLVEIGTNSDNKLYNSKTLDHAWQKGFTTVGRANHTTARYVANYVTKKISGPKAAAHYTHIDQYGEMHSIKPEYTRMSNRPGIGSTWYDKYKDDLHNHDHCIIEGKKYRVPRYYDNKLKTENENRQQEIKANRYEKSKNAGDTRQRLETRETVAKAKIENTKRKL